MPGYEYLQVDAGQLTENGISFHGYGWGRYDFADNNYFEDNGDGELLYGYFQYAAPENGLDLRLGRQNIASGVSTEAIDGLRISASLGQGFVASAYGGQAVGYTGPTAAPATVRLRRPARLSAIRFGDIGVSYKMLRERQ